MKNKELENVLEDIKELIKKLDLKKIKGEMISEIEKAFNEPAIISIEKQENGEAFTRVEGTTLAILVTLAGLEQTVLEKLEVPTATWEMIKDMVGTKEA